MTRLNDLRNFDGAPALIRSGSNYEAFWCGTDVVEGITGHECDGVLGRRGKNVDLFRLNDVRGDDPIDHSLFRSLKADPIIHFYFGQFSKERVSMCRDAGVATGSWHRRAGN